MAGGKGIWHYVKGAFNARVKVKGLGGVPVNWLGLLGFGVLGVLNPAFLLLGAGAELAYLAVLSHNGRFRKVVDGKGLLAEAARFERQREMVLSGLSTGDRARYEGMRVRCDRVREISDRLGGSSDPLTAMRQASLDRLLWIHLRLLQSRQVLAEQVESKSLTRVAAEIGAQEKRLEEARAAGADEALLRSLEGTLDILKRRRDALQTAGDKVRFIEAELMRIEQQVELIQEEAALARDGAHLSQRIDSVTSTLDETNAWMAANADALGAATDVEPPVTA